MPFNSSFRTTLVKKGYLDGPVKNVTDDKDITNGKSVRITYDKGFKYELVDSSECKVYYCKSDYCDNDGNGYTRVNYIESTGKQYIDTGYVFKNKPRITGEIMISTKGDMDIMGTNAEKAGCFIINSENSNIYYRYSAISYTLFNTGIEENVWYNVDFSDKVIINGIEKGLIDNYDFSSNNQSFFIGKGRNRYSKAKFKELKMYDGDELVRDLVPVYRNIDNKGGMFDTINKIFYISMTEDNFKYPPIEDSELNYIETTGKQYIDTGYVFKNKPRITGEIMVRTKSNMDIMGTPSLTSGCFIVNSEDSNIYYRYSNSTYTVFNTNIAVNQWYNVEFSDKIIINGIEKGSIDNYDFSSNIQSFLIGKARNYYSYVKFKELKVYDGDELVRDLVPYYKNDIDKVGMLDKVHNVFYENQGTGEFLWG